MQQTLNYVGNNQKFHQIHDIPEPNPCTLFGIAVKETLHKQTKACVRLNLLTMHDEFHLFLNRSSTGLESEGVCVAVRSFHRN